MGPCSSSQDRSHISWTSEYLIALRPLPLSSLDLCSYCFNPFQCLCFPEFIDVHGICKMPKYLKRFQTSPSYQVHSIPQVSYTREQSTQIPISKVQVFVILYIYFLFIAGRTYMLSHQDLNRHSMCTPVQKQPRFLRVSACKLFALSSLFQLKVTYSPSQKELPAQTMQITKCEKSKTKARAQISHVNIFHN